MQIPGKEYLADTALVTETITGPCCWSFCIEQQLVITNTIFRQKDRLKTTWMHPQSKHWHLIDYVLVHKRNLKNIIHTKVMPSAECHNDHGLVRCKFRLHFKPKLRKGGPPPTKSSNWTNFSLLKGKQTFRLVYCPSLKTATAPKYFSWNTQKSVILQTAEEVLGFTTKKN